MENKHCAVLIAAFNEEKQIASTLSNLNEQDFTVVVVNDGSTDHTGEIASASGAIVVNHIINCGQGAALNTGFCFIRETLPWIEYVITFDADGQHNVEDATKILDKLRTSQVDIVLGNRFGKESKIEVSYLKGVLLRFFAKLYSVVSGMKISDLHNGLRGFKASVLSDFELKVFGYGHADEILKIVRKKKLSYVEVAVSISYTKYSLSKGQPLSNFFIFIFDKLWRY